MIGKLMTLNSGHTAKYLFFGALVALVFLVACGGDGNGDGPVIDRIECPDKLVPGGECNILGRNLDLITEMQLGQGSLRVPVSQRGSKSLVIMTIPKGVTPGAYIIYYQTRTDTLATGRTIIVGAPEDTPVTAPATQTPTPPAPTVTPIPPRATAAPRTTNTQVPTSPPADIIRIAALEWESANIQAAIVSFIIEQGYEFQIELVPGAADDLWTDLVGGSLDVYLEAWTDSLGDQYKEAVDQGRIIPLGQSLDDSWQSTFVVPTYVIEGDPSRNIEPVAPDLRTPRDIRQYQGIFATRTTFPKARFVSCLSDWICSGVNEEKISNYGLQDVVEVVVPVNSDDLLESLADAYLQGKPWLGYMWGPTQTSTQFVLTRLEEEPYSEECWSGHKMCVYETARIRKAVHPDMTRKAPEVVDFLRLWGMDASTQVEAEKFLAQVGNEIEDMALWYLQNKESLWTEWVPEDVVDRVKQALDGS